MRQNGIFNTLKVCAVGAFQIFDYKLFSMSFKSVSKYVVCCTLYFFLTIVIGSQSLLAQNTSEMKVISVNDFERMDATEKRVHFIQWNNFSSQNEIPQEVEGKAIAFYKKNNIDERIYHKNKTLLRIITNKQLALSNRINACHFIIANYDNTIFPNDVVKDILDELTLQSK